MNAIPLKQLVYTQIEVIKLLKFRLNEISKIRDYFNSEIQGRKRLSKKLNKYIGAFDYFDKTLGGIFVTSFVSVVESNNKCNF